MPDPLVTFAVRTPAAEARRARRRRLVIGAVAAALLAVPSPVRLLLERDGQATATAIDRTADAVADATVDDDDAAMSNAATGYPALLTSELVTETGAARHGAR